MTQEKPEIAGFILDGGQKRKSGYLIGLKYIHIMLNMMIIPVILHYVNLENGEYGINKKENLR